jgi:glycosyltransferase involved in cell wall biosynthesis
MNIKQKALFITSRVPYPPNRGDRVRTYFLLKQFCERYAVTLISMYETEAEKAACSSLYQICENVTMIHHPKWLGLLNLMIAVFSRTPFQVAYYRNNKFKNAIKAADNTHHFSLLYNHLIRLAEYSGLITKSYRILDYTDCISLEYARSLEYRKGISKLFFTIESARTQRYELSVSKTFDECWVISSVDYKHLKLDTGSKGVIVPNQVNIPDLEKDYTLKQRIVFVGNMSVPHNVFAATYVTNTIMPALINKYPTLTFQIIGAHPVQEITDLENRNNTHVQGFVDDLYKELLNSDIFVAPMFFSAGIQNKVLEAMACGVPVVTTPAVAESLDCTSENELFTAETADSFIDICLHLLSYESMRRDTGSKGKEKIIKDFSFASVTAILYSRFDKIDNRLSQNLGELK